MTVKAAREAHGQPAGVGRGRPAPQRRDHGVARDQDIGLAQGCRGISALDPDEPSLPGEFTQAIATGTRPAASAILRSKSRRLASISTMT